MLLKVFLMRENVFLAGRIKMYVGTVLERCDFSFIYKLYSSVENILKFKKVMADFLFAWGLIKGEKSDDELDEI